MRIRLSDERKQDLQEVITRFFARINATDWLVLFAIGLFPT